MYPLSPTRALRRFIPISTRGKGPRIANVDSMNDENESLQLEIGPLYQRYINHILECTSQFKLAQPLGNLIVEYFQVIDIHECLKRMPKQYIQYNYTNSLQEKVCMYGYLKVTFQISKLELGNVSDLFKDNEPPDPNQPPTSYLLIGQEEDRCRLDRSHVEEAFKFAKTLGVTPEAHPFRWSALFWKIDAALPIPEYRDVYDGDGRHDTKVVTESKTLQDEQVDAQIAAHVGHLLGTHSPDMYPCVRVAEQVFSPRACHPNYFSVADLGSILKIVQIHTQDDLRRSLKHVDLDTEGNPIFVLKQKTLVSPPLFF